MDEVLNAIEQRLENCSTLSLGLEKGDDSSFEDIYQELGNIIFSFQEVEKKYPKVMIIGDLPSLSKAENGEFRARKLLSEIALKNSDFAISRLHLHALGKFPLKRNEVRTLKKNVILTGGAEKASFIVFSRIFSATQIYFAILLLYCPIQFILLCKGDYQAQMPFFISLSFILISGILYYIFRQKFFIKLTQVVAIFLFVNVFFHSIKISNTQILKWELKKKEDKKKILKKIQLEKFKKLAKALKKYTEEMKMELKKEEEIQAKKKRALAEKIKISTEKRRILAEKKAKKKKIEEEELSRQIAEIEKKEVLLDRINSKKDKEKSKQKNGLLLSENDLDKLRQINALEKKTIPLHKIVTAQKCGECHQKEEISWKKTAHFMGFSKMTKKPKSKDIFNKMGLSGSIKRNGRCSKCHFTEILKRGKPKAVSGVSCESCHGAAKDWILIRTNRKIPELIRRKISITNGMNDLANIYLIAKTCYECHSISDEELVNKGGHRASSKLEFVSWSQGSERHNYIRSNNTGNPKSEITRLRLMFVVGTMLKFEYAVRGLAKATDTKAKYYKIMKRNVSLAKKRQKILRKRLNNIKEITHLSKNLAKLDFTKKIDLQMAANLISLAARTIALNYNGSEMTAIEKYIPKTFK